MRDAVRLVLQELIKGETADAINGAAVSPSDADATLEIPGPTLRLMVDILPPGGARAFDPPSLGAPRADAHRAGADQAIATPADHDRRVPGLHRTGSTRRCMHQPS